jgi:hypothetical protein
MKNAIIAVLLSVLIFTTLFVVCDHVATAAVSNEEVMVGEGEYGGPIRKMFKKLKPRKRQREVEISQ